MTEIPREPVNDPVNHPKHYTSHPKGYECIDVIEDAPTGCLFNAGKYWWRVSFGSKGKDIEDLKKAVWYLEREIENRERKAREASQPPLFITCEHGCCRAEWTKPISESEPWVRDYMQTEPIECKRNPE